MDLRKDHTAPPSKSAPARPTRGGGVNWFRFWMQVLAAMLVFNVVAGLVTWYFIFPRLFPAHS